MEDFNNDNFLMEDGFNAALNVCKIRVVGVGGAGNNAVNRMIDAGVKGVDFFAVNTDVQALMMSKADSKNRIQIGKELTKGLGAGSYPEVGEKAANESRAELEKICEGIDLLFIAAGMGGGTGTGAAPVLAKLAKEKGCVIVGVVTTPFKYEGKKHEDNAKMGVYNLSKFVDTLIIVPNSKVADSMPKDTPVVEAFRRADDTLRQAICGIANLITQPSMINIDFADVKTVLKGGGFAHMGIGRATGENRIDEAIRQAVSSEQLGTSIEGASSLILNITGDSKMSIYDLSDAAEKVRSIVSYNANIIFGTNTVESMHDEVEITVIATGFVSSLQRQAEKTGGALQPTIQQPVQPTQPQVQVQEQKVEPVIETKAPIKEEQIEEIKEEVKEEVKEEPKKELPPFLKKLFTKK